MCKARQIKAAAPVVKSQLQADGVDGEVTLARLHRVQPGATVPDCMVRKPSVGLRLSPEELALVDALAAHEERSRSDVVRRAIHAYAERLGVTVKPTKRPKK